MYLYLKLGTPSTHFQDDASGLNLTTGEVERILGAMITPKILEAITFKLLVYATEDEYNNYLKSINTPYLSSSKLTSLVIYTTSTSQATFIPQSGNITSMGGGNGLQPSGVVPGTYEIVTVDTFGRVISGSNPTNRVPALFKFNIDLIGTVNGVNSTFQLPEDIFINTQSIYRNGVLQNPTGTAQNYSISGKVVTFTTPPAVGSILKAHYIKSI